MTPTPSEATLPPKETPHLVHAAWDGEDMIWRVECPYDGKGPRPCLLLTIEVEMSDSDDDKYECGYDAFAGGGCALTDAGLGGDIDEGHMHASDGCWVIDHLEAGGFEDTVRLGAFTFPPIPVTVDGDDGPVLTPVTPDSPRPVPSPEPLPKYVAGDCPACGHYHTPRGCKMCMCPDAVPSPVEPPASSEATLDLEVIRARGERFRKEGGLWGKFIGDDHDALIDRVERLVKFVDRFDSWDRALTPLEKEVTLRAVHFARRTLEKETP